MDIIEKQLILEFAKGNVSKEDFLNTYPVDLNEKPEYFIQLLENARKTANNEDIEFVLMIAGSIDSITSYLPIIRILICQNWHNQHENMVDILSFEEDKHDSKYFFHVLNQTYDYYKDSVEDFMVPIWVKCVWALGKIGTDEAKQYLEKFRNSPYEKVREAVEKQFLKYNWL